MGLDCNDCRHTGAPGNPLTGLPLSCWHRQTLAGFHGSSPLLWAAVIQKANIAFLPFNIGFLPFNPWLPAFQPLPSCLSVIAFLPFDHLNSCILRLLAVGHG